MHILHMNKLRVKEQLSNMSKNIQCIRGQTDLRTGVIATSCCVTNYYKTRLESTFIIFQFLWLSNLVVALMGGSASRYP